MTENGNPIGKRSKIDPAAMTALAAGARPAIPATVPTSAAATAAAPVVDGAWQSRVAGWLAAHRTYPDEARRRGEEGRVVVRVTVDRSGRVLDAGIVAGSGSERLDAATIALVRDAALPAFPPSMAQARVTILAPLRYTLR